MKPSDFDRMMKREDPDVQFLMGQREAARWLLHTVTKHMDSTQRQIYANIVKTAYENQRANPSSSHHFKVLGPGFLEFCRLFLEVREWDDDYPEAISEDFS